MPWIRTYSKSHPSFSRACLDRDGVITSLRLAPDTIKSRIRKRSASCYEVIVWRRGVIGVPPELATPVRSASSKSNVPARSRFAAIAALAMLAHSRSN